MNQSDPVDLSWIDTGHGGRHRGIVRAVARELGVGENFVTRVLRGSKTSRPVAEALVQKAKAMDAARKRQGKKK